MTAGVPRLLFAIVAMLLSPLAAAADRIDVDVVIGERSSAQDELLAAMRDALGNVSDRAPRLRVRTASGYRPDRQPTGRAQLIVTVGVAAAEAVLREHPSLPVFSAFIPHSVYERLRERIVPGRELAGTSALYVDQPFDRQMRLLRVALPDLRQVGTVLGPASDRAEAPLREAASAAGLGVRVERITEERQLVGAVHRTLDRAGALLAVPDPLIYNRHTAQNVLLTAYRQRKPVIGYSAAYVHAGALMAVFSTPAQIGRQLGEMLAGLAPAPAQLPPPRHPRYFSVEVNERVARSLGLRMSPAGVLARQLAEAEDGVR